MVRPLDYLKATELIFDLEVSPLRLYIDQETLDFVVRFVTFKDSRFGLVDRYPELPFIQRFRINYPLNLGWTLNQRISKRWNSGLLMLANS